MEKIRITKKLESTKEHLQTVKKQYETKIAQLEIGTVSAPQKQNKRKRKSKKANCNLDGNTKPHPENGAATTNKELLEPPEAPTSNQISPNHIFKTGGHTVKKSDVGNS